MSITVLAEKESVTARKVHCCQLCLGRISVGSKHYTQRCAGDGSVWTWRAHRQCRLLEATYRMVMNLDPYDDEGIDPDEFCRWLDESNLR